MKKTSGRADTSTDHYLEDTRSGLQQDTDGRRWFRQRRVRFHTIDFQIHDILRADWIGYAETLQPLDWDAQPEERAIMDFARQCSLRYVDYWYRILDVVLARSLCGRRTEIFETNLLIGGPLLDLGIPAEARFSSLPPSTHRAILQEYYSSRETPLKARIYYLSDYLEGMNADLIELLLPFRQFWLLERKREHLQMELKQHHKILTEPLKQSTAKYDSTCSLEICIQATIDKAITQIAIKIKKLNQWHTIENNQLRNLLHRLHQQPDISLDISQRAMIFDFSEALHIPRHLQLLYKTIALPDQLLRKARQIAAGQARIYQLSIRIIRLRSLRNGSTMHSEPEAPRRRLLALKRQQEEYLKQWQQQINHQGTSSFLKSRALLFYLRSKHNVQDWLHDFIYLQDNPTLSEQALNAARQDLQYLQAFQQSLTGLKTVENKLLELFCRASKISPKNITKSDNPQSNWLPPTELMLLAARRYPMAPGLESEILSAIGNPFMESEVLGAARKIMLHRLRPIRRVSNYYSTISGHRHGAIPLNPVMKLWHRGFQKSRHLPSICLLRFNTPHSLQCLLALAELADPGLNVREIQREKILREKRGIENLKNMNIFLLPGSCFPLREIHRLDFPEFRGRVIGESRTALELGLDRSEEAVLTGGWYQKFNHSLYYPVGGDNANLLATIWDARRLPFLPAFLFALGQFVHDCLPDALLYHKFGSDRTFRECIEDYYRQEDKVRKNRGEKTGRRRLDNSRDGVRFMFAVLYARLLLELLSGSSQSEIRHRATEDWMATHLDLQLLRNIDRTRLKHLRARVRNLMQEHSQ